MCVVLKTLNIGADGFSTEVESALVRDKRYHTVKMKIGKAILDLGVATKDKKSFLKTILKTYDSVMSNFSDEMLLTIGSVISIPDVEKVALFLRFKKGLDYKQRVDMVKTLSNISLQELVYSEKMLSAYLIGVSMGSVERNDNNEDARRYLDYILIYKNTITLLKCIVYSYYKYAIVGFEKGKIRKKILPTNKAMYTFNRELRVYNTKFDLDALLELYKKIEKNESSYMITDDMIGTLLYTYLDDVLLNDDYVKMLLDESYDSTINNRLNSLIDVDKLPVSSGYFINRKILLPNSGVILLIKDSPIIESILLKEKKLNARNNLVIITRYIDGKECSNSVVLDRDLMYEEWVTVRKDESGYGERTTIGYVLNFLCDIESIDGLNYEVIAPTYWKYRGVGYSSSSDVVDSRGVVVKREFEIEVAPFLRKIKGECGLEACKLAKELGILLGKGYTIVKPHIRLYNKQRN